MIEATSDQLRIIDGDDVRLGVLVPGLDPDTYVTHPSVAPRRVSVVTDRGRVDFVVAPGQTYDFAIRRQGRLYPQRITTIDPSPPVYRGGANRRGGVDEIPFRLGSDNSIYVSASLNESEPLNLSFDTGASISVLGASGRARGAVIRAGDRNSLRFGDVTIDDIPVISIEGGRTRTAEELETASAPATRTSVWPFRRPEVADGLIGYDVFAGKVIEIDHERGVLRVSHDRPDTRAYSRIPVIWRGAAAMVPMGLAAGGDRRTILALLDTGSNFSLTLNHDDPLSTSSHDLPFRGWRRGRKSDGGAVWSDVLVVPSLSFGDHALRDVQIDVARGGDDARLDFNLIGNDYLKRFDLIIDYRTSEVFVRPNSLVGEPYKSGIPARAIIVSVLIAAFVVMAAAVVGLRHRRRLRIEEKTSQRR